MKKLAYFLFIISSSSSHAALLTAASSTNDCLIAGSQVELVGKIGSETFPGRPNFESIQDGDEPETFWVLTAEKPYCGKGYTYQNKKFYRLQGSTKRFQLIMQQDQYNQQNHLLDKKVLIKGQVLVHSSNHHHTKMIIQVSSINEISNKEND